MTLREDGPVEDSYARGLANAKRFNDEWTVNNIIVLREKVLELERDVSWLRRRLEEMLR